jgi:hypothetical protein
LRLTTERLLIRDLTPSDLDAVHKTGTQVELRLRRIVATTEYDNAASIAVMRKLGFRIERNPGRAPFFLQVVGIVENPSSHADWPEQP